MSDYQELVQDIQLVLDTGTAEATGFYTCYCPVCGEGRRKTGGFKFEHDHIIYNCFRGKCDATCVYTVNEPVSKKFKNLMESINVKIPPSLLVKKQSLADKIQSLDSNLYAVNSYNAVVFPDGKLSDHIPDYWIQRLEKRAVDVDAVDVKYVESGKYRDNIAIPFHFHNMVIGYQVMTRTGKYISLFGGQKHPLYIPAKKLNPEFVLVVEGTVDAMCFPNTVAITGNEISPEQAYHLRGANVVMLPDRSGGNKFPYQFHEYGWGLCVPPWPEKDLNEAVCAYGHMQVAQMVVDNIYTGRVQGRTAYNMWKENGKNRKR